MNQPNRWKVFAYMAALFVAGGICGAMVMNRMSTNSQTLTVNRAPEITAKIKEKLSTRLGLTSDQMTALKPVIDKTSEEMEASHRDCLKRISLALDNLHDQIGPVLTSDQKPLLDALRAEKKESMWKRYRYRDEAASSTNK